MAASSSSSSPLSVTSGFIENSEFENELGGWVTCDCPGGFRAQLFCTRKAGMNYGRRFYGCRNWDKKDGSRPFCNICKWVDAKYPPRTAEVIMELKCQRDGLEQERDELREEGNQLRMKMRSLYGQLREKSSALSVLSKEISEMKEEIRVVKNFGYMMVVFVFLLLIVVVRCYLS